MDQPMKVKICGLTNPEDARLAASFGADFLGLNFCEGPRRVGIAEAQEIMAQVSTSMNWVGIFKNEQLEIVRELARTLNLKWIQLHGSEDLYYVRLLRHEFRVLRVFEIGNRTNLHRIETYPEEWILLDVPKDSSQTMDWTLAEQIARKRKVFLAGGLRLDNIGEVVRKVRPYAVDVCRGVERFPAKKDAKKLEAFIRTAKMGVGK